MLEFPDMPLRTLLPRNHGGVDAESVIVIDADNSSSPYLYLNIAREYGMHYRNVTTQGSG